MWELYCQPAIIVTNSHLPRMSITPHDFNSPVYVTSDLSLSMKQQCLTLLSLSCYSPVLSECDPLIVYLQPFHCFIELLHTTTVFLLIHVIYCSFSVILSFLTGLLTFFMGMSDMLAYKTFLTIEMTQSSRMGGISTMVASVYLWEVFQIHVPGKHCMFWISLEYLADPPIFRGL